MIAYEPVSAIGTGKVVSAAQAQDAHANTRAFLAQAVSPAVAQGTRVIYGGSVNAANCKELGACPVLFRLVASWADVRAACSDPAGRGRLLGRRGVAQARVFRH